MTTLKDKAAIITGASSGIGRATAILFAQKGARIIIGSRRKNELDKLVDKIYQQGGQAIALAGDVTSEDYHKSNGSADYNDTERRTLGANTFYGARPGRIHH